MLAFQKIVEERIREAIERGDFHNLEGMGEPLEKEESMPIRLTQVRLIPQDSDPTRLRKNPSRAVPQSG